VVFFHVLDFSEFSMPSHFFATNAENYGSETIFSCFGWFLAGFVLPTAMLGGRFWHFVEVVQGHSESTSAAKPGLVFATHRSFEHSKTTMVHGTPKCTNPQTLSEIHVISFSSRFLSTLDHLHKVPKSAF
jgi:hypothetical protein